MCSTRTKNLGPHVFLVLINFIAKFSTSKTNNLTFSHSFRKINYIAGRVLIKLISAYLYVSWLIQLLIIVIAFQTKCCMTVYSLYSIIDAWTNTIILNHKPRGCINDICSSTCYPYHVKTLPNMHPQSKSAPAKLFISS